MASLYFRDQKAQQQQQQQEQQGPNDGRESPSPSPSTFLPSPPSPPRPSSPVLVTPTAATSTTVGLAATPSTTGTTPSTTTPTTTTTPSTTDYENSSQYLDEEEADRLRRKALEDDAKPLPKMNFLGIREDADGMMVLDAQVVQPWEGGVDGNGGGSHGGGGDLLDDSTMVSSLTDYTGLRSMYSTQTPVDRVVADAMREAELAGKDPHAAAHNALIESRIHDLANQRAIERRQQQEKNQNHLPTQQEEPHPALSPSSSAPYRDDNDDNGQYNSNDYDGDGLHSPQSRKSQGSRRSLIGSAIRSIIPRMSTTTSSSHASGSNNGSRRSSRSNHVHEPIDMEEPSQGMGNTGSSSQSEGLIATHTDLAAAEAMASGGNGSSNGSSNGIGTRSLQQQQQQQLQQQNDGGAETFLDEEYLSPLYQVNDELPEDYRNNSYSQNHNSSYSAGGGSDGLDFMTSSNYHDDANNMNNDDEYYYPTKPTSNGTNFGLCCNSNNSGDRHQRRKLILCVVSAIIVIGLIVSVGFVVSNNDNIGGSGNSSSSSSSSNNEEFSGKFEQHPAAKPTPPPKGPEPQPTQAPDGEITDENDVPLNNLCENALHILAAGVPVKGTTLNASPDDDMVALSNCGGVQSDGGAVWFTFVGSGIDITASTCGSGFITTHISILEAPGGDMAFADFDIESSPNSAALMSSWCNDGNDNQLMCVGYNTLTSGEDNCASDAEVTFRAEAGHVYFVVVRGVDGTSGNFQITLDGTGPINNSCEDAVEPNYFEAGAFLYGTNVGASIDRDATCDGIEPNGNGVWYKLSGYGARRLIVSTCWMTDFDTRISIFKGSCNNLICIKANDDYCGRQSRVEFDSEFGEVYYILIHGYMASTGNFNLNVADKNNLYNDFCLDAKFLTYGRRVSGNNELARFDFAAQETCGKNVPITGPTVWYEVTGTGGEMIAHICDSNFDAQVSVFAGSCDTLACVGGTSDAASELCPNGGIAYKWTSISFETYMIAVHGVNAAIGSFDIVVEEIQGGATTSLTCQDAAGPLRMADTTFFFAEAGLLIDDSLLTCNPNNNNRNDGNKAGSWFYVIGDGGQVTASLCSSLTSGTISIFQGDSCGNIECISDGSKSCFTFFPTEMGQRYYLYIETRHPGDSQLSLATSGPPPASNNECTGAIPLKIDGDVIYGTTEDASVAVVPDQFCGEQVVSPGVWFTIEGTGSGIAVGLCVGTTFDTTISVFEGTCDGLQCIGGNDDFCDLQSAFNWESTAGSTYYVLVHGFDSTDVGEFGIVAISN